VLRKWIFCNGGVSYNKSASYQKRAGGHVAGGHQGAGCEATLKVMYGNCDHLMKVMQP